MKPPTVTEAYAMIRLLKQRAGKGDADRIAQLTAIIKEAMEKEAQLNLDKYFPSK